MTLGSLSSQKIVKHVVIIMESDQILQSFCSSVIRKQIWILKVLFYNNNVLCHILSSNTDFAF